MRDASSGRDRPSGGDRGRSENERPRTGGGPRSGGAPRTGGSYGGASRGGPQGDRPSGGRPSGAPGERGGRGGGPGGSGARGPRSAEASVRRVEPPLPDDVTGAELDRDVRSDLLTLAKDNAVAVSRHLVMAGRLLDEDPEAAYAHAMAAQRRAGRIGSVREAAGLAAYGIGAYDEALRELRTARRLTGSDVHLPLMADCERALGRPEKALELAASPEAARLDVQRQIEMRIVASGARTDMGQPDAAVVTLQGPELSVRNPQPWHARLMSAYADALAAAGRAEEAQTWLQRAEAADRTGATGAGARLSGEEDVVVYDLLEDDDEAPADRPSAG